MIVLYGLGLSLVAAFNAQPAWLDRSTVWLAGALVVALALWGRRP